MALSSSATFVSSDWHTSTASISVASAASRPPRKCRTVVEARLGKSAKKLAGWVAQHRKGVRASGRAVKGAASRVQNLWRRKTEVDRGRRYRDSAKKISSYIAAKRTTMLMNRKGKAVDVIAHFLTENANARKHIHRVIKNLLKATRRIQRYWREFAVVSSHRTMRNAR